MSEQPSSTFTTSSQLSRLKKANTADIDLLKFKQVLSGKAYVGLSEKEILRSLGEPTDKRNGVWEYGSRVPRSPGYHSFAWMRVVRFKNGRVVSAEYEPVFIG